MKKINKQKLISEWTTTFQHVGLLFPSDMTNILDTKGFFDTPASTKFHGVYPGGLAIHSMNVATTLGFDLTRRNRLEWSRPGSPYIIGLFHDLCKMDNYIWKDDKWCYNTETDLTGHGDKSIMLLSQYTTLTEEEIMCIRYHMGAFTDKEEWKYYTGALKKYPNVLWTHQADMIATHFLDENEDLYNGVFEETPKLLDD